MGPPSAEHPRRTGAGREPSRRRSTRWPPHDAEGTVLSTAADLTPETLTFADLGIDPRILAALDAAAITVPFPVQALTIPLALRGQDVIGQARTGTGKTIAFGLPLLQRLTLPGERLPQALVVCPTRELAIQVSGDIARFGKPLGARVTTVYGGRAYEPQIEALQRGVDVVVGTPGRLLDLAGQRHLDLSAVSALVLDEADEMLDLGFLPDVEKLVAQTPAARQTLLFSATMPAPIITLARRYLTNPTHMRAEDPHETAVVPTTAQHVYRTHPMDKIEILSRLLQAEGRSLTIVFCRTKRMADRVAGDLAERGFAAAAVHGDLGQGARERALRAFRSGKVDVLVATDVAARGIDVTGVTHVVNYDCPEDDKVYLHRIGRTGRAGAEGAAVTFVDWSELTRWKLINSALDLPFAEPPETYSTSPWLYDELKIPAGATGTLPRNQRTRAGLGAEEVEDLGETGRARKNSSGRNRGGRPAAPGSPASSARAERPARNRTRRRTRAGQAAPATTVEHPPAERPRRRRRRSGGRSTAPEGQAG